jgi:hypothetical protein
VLANDLVGFLFSEHHAPSAFVAVISLLDRKAEASEYTLDLSELSFVHDLELIAEPIRTPNSAQPLVTVVPSPYEFDTPIERASSFDR